MRPSAVLGGLAMAVALSSPGALQARDSVAGIDATRVLAEVPAGLDARFASMSYAPFARGQTPARDRPTAVQIRSDLSILAPYTRAVRIYAPVDGLEAVVPIAAELGLDVLLGIWLVDDEARNERQIEAALALANRYSNVRALLVGNETTLGAEDPASVVQRLIAIIERVRPLSPVPVSTAEFWHIWRDHPELVRATDFIAAHILPYWENVAPRNAASHALAIYRRLQAAHPGTRILIGEFGWPSQRYEGHATGETEQAEVVRSFVARAQAQGIEYNLIEAFDQPWKTHEGHVGGHWGVFDADRKPKPVIEGLIY